MSRNLRTSSSRPSLKPPTTPVKARTTGPTTPARVRTQSTKSTPASKAPHAAAPAQDPPPPPLSIKEAIALRRAEAKKARATMRGDVQHDSESLEDASPLPPPKQEEEDILGRLPIRETIERARSTGTLNLATRSLRCIPSALFEIHLGIKPDPLKSVPDEPVLPPSTPAEPRGRRNAPAWFEAQDLQVLKIWNNDIEEIQHEISLFGSLKNVDLHQNKLASLPTTFADLTALTTLDLSHNGLTSLPANIFALPDLSNLNISHNSLEALPFNAPFTSGSNGTKKQTTGGSFFAPTITRATSPLPRLLFLDASHNKISAMSIDLQIPTTLTKLDLSANPLGIDCPECRSLLQVLGDLPKLKELRLESAEIGDDVFPSTLFSSLSSPFPSIRVLDLGQTKATPGAVKEALHAMKQKLSFDVTAEEPVDGVASIIVGKRIIKEAWEIELERQEKTRKSNHNADFDDWDTQPTPTQPNKGASAKPMATHIEASGRPVVSPRPPEVVKEAWELEAERGLLTEGGKRRARAAAAAAAATGSKTQSNPTIGAASGVDRSSSPSGSSLAGPKYYSKLTQTLTLPPSSPPSKSPAHSRTFSVGVVSSSIVSSARSTDLAVPSPTLPLSLIATQPFAHTLKTLILVNRRLDKSFSVPHDTQGGLLPLLEELDLEGCGLADLVPVTRSGADAGTVTPPRSTEQILPLIAKLFPTLLTLNLSGNALTNSAFTVDALSALILATPERRGLKHLRIRGNRISELEGFRVLAESFKGNRQIPEWRLDELDIRDNEIGKLPAEIGLLPLDVFLVDGNTFRVPPRRVWEREGTKGLLSWLRGRIE